MISLDQPAMVCNDWQMRRDNITRFQMWNSWEVPQTASAANIIGHILNVAASAPGGKLRHLVINCHGEPGRMYLGDWHVRHDTVQPFKRLAGRVGRIWLVSCQVAGAEFPRPEHIARANSLTRVTQAAANAGMTVENYLKSRVLNGNFLCRAIAVGTGALVTAAIHNQWGDARPFLPFGMIDRFEGMQLTWDSRGQVVEVTHNTIAEDAPQ